MQNLIYFATSTNLFSQPGLPPSVELEVSISETLQPDDSVPAKM